MNAARSACRACGATRAYEVLDLGAMPLAGDFRKAGERNALYPLAIDGCASCGILQVREMLPPDAIFTDHYSFASSTVPGLVRHFGEYARDAGAGAGRKLLEVGCNDGVFLAPLRDAGFDVVGIDASANVADLARKKGFPVHTGFFDREAGRRLRAEHGAFDVVTCSNVFAHNPDVNGFIEGVAAALSERGEFWVEVHDARALHDALQWDCFYHEHAYYWTLQALQRRLAAHGFRLIRSRTTPMHGGALRAVFARGPASDIIPGEPTAAQWGVFRERCLRSRVVLQETIAALPIRYAYGAAGRAVTLINWAGLAKRLEFVVDGSPLRYGRVVPNTDVPVLSEAEYFERSDLNDWCFVTAHNYLDDIRRKVEARRGPGVKFVTPLPHVAIR